METAGMVVGMVQEAVPVVPVVPGTNQGQTVAQDNLAVEAVEAGALAQLRVVRGNLEGQEVLQASAVVRVAAAPLPAVITVTEEAAAAASGGQS